MKKLLLLLAILSVAIPSAGFAEETSNVRPLAPKPMPIRSEVRKEVKEVRDEVRKDIKEVREEAKEVREDAREVRKEILDSAKEQREEARKQLKGDPEVRKIEIERIKNEREQKMEENRAKLQESLKAIKDKTKATIVVRVADGLNTVNKKMTDQFTQTLTKLKSILTRISDKDATVDIANATNLITTAQTAVDAQALKSYTVTVTTETNLKVNASESAQALRTDLSAVQEQVKAARKAVEEAYKLIK